MGVVISLTSSASSGSKNSSEQAMEFSNVKRNPPVKEGKAQLVKKEGNRNGIEGPKSSDPKASELQTSMIQIMEAVEREKQKHNSTMMEAIAWLAELETVNAELATSLATAQITLERGVTRVGELRQQVELKEVAIEEYKRNILKIQQNSPSLDEAISLQNSQIKQEILDAEYSFICDKLSKLKDKTKVKNASRGDISENNKCKLIHWCVDGVVAEGRITSTDSNARVHDVPLGGPCWKVWIDRVFVEKVDILRPNEVILFLRMQ